jgi:NTE family protein
VLAEAAEVRAAGTEVLLLGPGPEDLQAMGANLMDPRRRSAVLATSLRTSAEALRRAGGSERLSRRTGTAGQ